MVRLRRASTFTASTNAQAFVVGAALILAIVVAATILYLSIYAPIETKKSEFQHASKVTEDFTALESTIKYLSNAESSGASKSVPITGRPAKESIIVLPHSSGSISFSSTAENITVWLNEPGTGTPGMWTDDNFTITSASNVDISSGNTTLVGPPYSWGYIESNMSAAEGFIGYNTGSNSTIYENISWHTIIPQNTELIMKVRTDMFPNMTHAKEWYECPGINSQNGFNKISPSDLSSVSNGHRYVQYRAELKTWDPSETPTLIDVTVNFSSSSDGVILAESSGSITFANNYHYLPNQVLTYENGALIKSQTAGGFVVRPFYFSFANVSGMWGNRTRINVSLVNLTGTNVPAYSGAPIIMVRLFRGDYNLVSDSFFYPNLILNISTEYPSICGDWFNKTLEESGLSVSSYNVDVDTTAKDVEVTFYGHGEGVELYLEKTAVDVQIPR